MRETGSAAGKFRGRKKNGMGWKKKKTTNLCFIIGVRHMCT